jgi:hypothetical protein
VATGYEDGLGFLHKIQGGVKEQIEIDLSHRHAIWDKETTEGRWA